MIIIDVKVDKMIVILLKIPIKNTQEIKINVIVPNLIENVCDNNNSRLEPCPNFTCYSAVLIKLSYS